MSEPKEKKFSNLAPEFFAKFKALVKEFSVIPAATPAATTTPTTTPAVTVPSTPAATTTPAAKFGEGKLKDGTSVKWDGEQLVAGVPIMVVDPANPSGFLPAPDGEHELDNGAVIVVAEGKVVEVKQPAATVDPNAPNIAQVAQMSADLKELKDQFNKVSKDKEDQETAFKKQFEAQRKELDEVKGLVKSVFELVGAMIETPTGEPHKKPESTPSKLSKGAKFAEKLQAYNSQNNKPCHT